MLSCCTWENFLNNNYTCDGVGIILKSFFLGFIMFSVEHPDISPPERDCTRICIGNSGIILRLWPGPSEWGCIWTSNCNVCGFVLKIDNEPHTKLTIVGRVALFGAMHKMLKGAYNSGVCQSVFCHFVGPYNLLIVLLCFLFFFSSLVAGLLKVGLRSTFSLISEQLERYLEITNM